MTLVLGLKPDDLQVVLVDDADFQCTLTLDTGTWPAGATLQLVFDDAGGPTTWSATITGADAVFDQDKATTTAAALPAGTGVKLVYTSGTTDQVWAAGEVTRP